MSGIVVDTLQKLKDGGYRLWASCSTSHECTHYADLDTDVLIAKFGADFDFVENRERLAQSLSCSKCGRKGIQVRIATDKTFGAGTSPSVW